MPALIILSREILVSGLREFLAGTRVSVPVTAIAKFKTAMQMVAIGAMILTPLADRFVPGVPALTYSAVAYALLWIAAALTVYTGVVYFKNGLTHIRPRPGAGKGPRVTLLYFAWVRQKIGKSEERSDAGRRATSPTLIAHLKACGAELCRSLRRSDAHARRGQSAPCRPGCRTVRQRRNRFLPAGDGRLNVQTRIRDPARGFRPRPEVATLAGDGDAGAVASFTGHVRKEAT